MASLVADYGSGSESDKDSDVEETLTVEKKRIETESSKGPNFLLGDVDNNEESDEEKAESEEKIETVLDNPFTSVKSKLPNPLADNRMGKKGSVFITEYQIAAASKDSILEQHVKMTNCPSGQEKTIGGKKVCWNYRKLGRCNKGHKCQFAHDSDLTGNSEISSSSSKCNVGSLNYSYHGNAVSKETVDDDNYMANAKKRKRAGVKNSLVPPKKAMAQLDKMREKERPWTKR